MYSKVSFAHCVLYKVNGQGQHNVTALKLKLNRDTFDKFVSANFFLDFFIDRVNKMNLFLPLSTNAIIIFLKKCHYLYWIPVIR